MSRFPVFTHPLPSPVISLFTRRLTGSFISGPSWVSRMCLALPASRYSLSGSCWDLLLFHPFPRFLSPPTCVCVCVRESTCVFLFCTSITSQPTPRIPFVVKANRTGWPLRVLQPTSPPPLHPVDLSQRPGTSSGNSA